MAKLVDATDLIGLSLGMETYQVITFKFRETQEFSKFGCEPRPNAQLSMNLGMKEDATNGGGNPFDKSG